MSKYVVSARKYRPSTFDELVGQPHIASTLKNALVNNQLAHAFLFCGPRGVGKTTSARILAKVINCENPQNGGVDPCNECSSCLSFNDQASFNIIELDAASNNSVEHIRTLIEQVRFQPQQGKYKVFIIDEVHMLSSQAFNAFLKTLEEPPPYAIFILATTEKHKILPTILSRCQIFDFKRIMANDIVVQLEHINQAENRTADHEALFMIGQKADGAMRDALSIYDKIASAAGDHISYHDVIENLNILDYDYYFSITDNLLKQDLSQVLLTLDEVIRKGFESDLFIQGLAEHLRSLLVSKNEKTLGLLEGGEALKSRYRNQATIAPSGFIMSALSIINECDISLARANNKRLYVEIALGKINHLQHLLNGEFLIEKKTIVESSPLDIKRPVQEKKVKKVSEQQPNENFISHQSSQQSETSSFSDTEADINKDTVQEKVPEEKQDSPTSEAVESANTNESTEAEPSPETGKDREGLIINTPSFSNYSNLLSTIKEKEAFKKEARKKLSYEAIEDIWVDYTDKVDSKSIQTALKLAKKNLEGTTLELYVPNSLTRDMIIQESSLLERIREELGVDDLTLHAVIDLDKFPGWDEVETKKKMTNREKYEMMVDKNPLIKDLRVKFDLEIDKG